MDTCIPPELEWRGRRSVVLWAFCGGVREGSFDFFVWRVARDLRESPVIVSGHIKQCFLPLHPRWRDLSGEQSHQKVWSGSGKGGEKKLIL